MRITAKQLAQTFFDLTNGKSKSEVEKITIDFARYMQKERKLKLAEKIIEQFGKIYDRENGIVDAEIVTAQKLESQQEKNIKKYIKEKYPPAGEAGRAKEVVLKNTVDEKIKGGMIIKIGDEVMDGSIKNKLSRLRKELST